jgi:co-chaperonin GroES (HSP10)
MTVIKEKCPVRPTKGKILVREDGFKYEGRILIPEKVQKRPTTGTIVAIGKFIDAEEYLIDDRVCYGLYSGTVINIRNMPVYRILTEDEILCFIPKTAELEGVGVGQ